MAAVEQTDRVPVPGAIARAPAFPWNDDVPGEASGACVHHLVQAQALRTPDAVAVSRCGARLTYAQLESRANQLARRLRRLGVGPEVPVAVFMERAPEVVAAMLGVLKAGGAYVPLDPAYPRARLELMLADTRAPVLLTQPSLAGRLPAGDAAVVALDGGFSVVADESAEPFESGAGPENLSHVIYTSGSTGTPKGVMIRHSSVATLIGWAPRALGIRPGTPVLASTSVCFDVHVAETWVPLALGARVVLVPNALHLASLPAGETVEVASMVPSAAAELLRTGGIPACVRALNLGGEPLRGELAQELYGALPALEQVVNLYGPTEDTTYSTWHRPARGVERTMPVGVPVDGSRVYVLDAALRPVGAGETGEIWMAGAGVSRGYVARPGLTAWRFLPDPWSPEPGARMYRTGDRGRGAPDGVVECLGRADHQVKVRGHRVELAEVEGALRRHPAVADAAAAVRGDALVGYVVAAGAAAPSAAELRATVAEHLPHYMVPGLVVALPALPRLPNGKVDRGALPAPEVAAAEAYVAPRTPAEAAVCDIWAQVLGVERVGVEDDFFDLGGHSLRATQIMARVRQALGAELSPFAVFDLRTPAALAREAERAALRARGGDVPALVPLPRDRPIPLSASQQAIWFFQELSPGMRSYNFQAAIRFDGALDVPALERALGEIVRRHEIFRTVFVEVDGEPRQVIHDPWPVRLSVQELGDVPAESRQAALEGRLREEFFQPFHLDRLPLVRWSLYRMGDDAHVLASVEHHFVHDGWSFGVLLRELAALYGAFVAGRPSPLPEPALQFADYALWQREWLGTETARRQLDYWRRRLADATQVLELPTDHPRPPVMSFRGRSLRYRLPPELARGARELGRRHGATLYQTLLAAFELLMSRYSGQEGFCLGGSVANRNHPAAEGLIGMIVNMVALRADLSGAPTVGELLARVRRTGAEAYAHREVPFGEVVEAVQPRRSLSHLPIYQVSFSFHDAPYPPFDLPGARMSVTEALSNESAKFDLQVIAIPRGSQQAGADEEVTMIWEYATDLFEAATVARMETHYRTLLAEMLADPDRSVADLPMLDEAERARVLTGWNETTRAFADARPVHLPVGDQARRTPDAVAVQAEDGTLTYAELGALANRVAHRLRAAGIGPEDRVAVCLERSRALPAVLLGILGAGAAYVPLDPGYPADRIAFVLRDCGASLLVTHSALAARLPPGAAEGALLIDRAAAELDALPATAPADRSDPASIAYIIYTSGSTGRPKGVAVPHGALANHMAWMAERFPLGADDRVLQKTPVMFDASVWEFWAPLLAGARLVMARPGGERDSEYLVSTLVRERITVLQGVPTLLRMLADEPGLEDASALRLLFCGGEALPRDVVSKVSKRVGAEIHNLYGPTEACIDATSHRADTAGPEPVVAIGGGIANTRLYVLDARMQPVPAGAAGELYVAGAGLARGYLGRPGLTASRFVPEPFSGEPGARMYRTGDQVRWRECVSAECVSAECVSAEKHDLSGEPCGDRTPALPHSRTPALEYLGRLDHQLKVRGFRIEPGEIEAALAAHPGVREAAVVAVEDAAGTPRLAAYVVPVAGTAPDADALREHLRGSLPEYMVPSAFVALERLPLTPNGKLDRAALPAPAMAEEGRRAYEAPRDPAEEALAAIWAEVLGVPRVGIHDDFFALGGHSLLATQVLRRARAALGMTAPLAALFQHPTVAGLAGVLAPEEEAAEPVRRIEPVRDAAALLEGLDSLSPEEIDALLGSLAAEP
jgi:amino acid adenylation domain-containing protein